MSGWTAAQIARDEDVADGAPLERYVDGRPVFPRVPLTAVGQLDGTPWRLAVAGWDADERAAALERERRALAAATARADHVTARERIASRWRAFVVMATGATLLLFVVAVALARAITSG